VADRVGPLRRSQFFLHLFSYLETAVAQGKIDDPEHNTLAEDILDNSDGTLFDREKKVYEDLADRSEDLIVRHCTREIVAGLKPYFGKYVFNLSLSSLSARS